MRFANLFSGVVVALVAFKAQAHTVVSDDGCYGYDAQYFLQEKHTPINKVEEEKATPIISAANSAIRTGYYVEFKSGVYAPMKLNEEFKVFKKPKSAPVFELRGGYNWKDFGIDLTLTHGAESKVIRDNHTQTGLPLIPGPGFGDFHFIHRVKTKFTSLIFSSYYNIFHYNGFTPYIGAGIGMSRNTFGDINTNSDYTGITYSKKRKGHTINNFVWQAMIGARFAISRNMELSAEYKYMDLKSMQAGTQYINAGGAVGTTPVEKSKYKISSYLLGLRYYF